MFSYHNHRPHATKDIQSLILLECTYHNHLPHPTKDIPSLPLLEYPYRLHPPHGTKDIPSLLLLEYPYHNHRAEDMAIEDTTLEHRCLDKPDIIHISESDGNEDGPRNASFFLPHPTKDILSLLLTQYLFHYYRAEDMAVADTALKHGCLDKPDTIYISESDINKDGTPASFYSDRRRLRWNGCYCQRYGEKASALITCRR